ncbi:MAG: biopolymer transporter ExbD [Prevotella sp.]|nr:biopolymer transporter ExbD [Prevotella sp.]
MASMPDLIFTVLFFFMIVTHMRNETVKVKLQVPQGTEVTKSSNKFSTINIYIGRNNYGDTQIQVNDRMCSLEQVGTLVRNFKANLSEESQENLIINLRADRNTDMGIVNDLKKELRKIGALTIRYSATEKTNVK